MSAATTLPLNKPGSSIAAGGRLRHRIGISAIGWAAPIEDMRHPDWVSAGRQLGAMGRGSNWWVGDWIRYGTARWGEKYVEAARITGYDVHSLRNMAYVASRFELSLRRDNLTWSHHALLAALEPDQQVYWLDRAATQNMSVADLRLELRSVRRVSKRATDLTAPQSERDVESDIVCPNCGSLVPFPGTSVSSKEPPD
jgi:hypothetical protein